jgi:hypothetical protein
MVHLNVVRADVVCATHVEHSAEPAGHTAHHASHQHHATAPDASSVANDASCETPSQPDCCQALASCSVSAVAAVEVAIAQANPTHVSAPSRSVLTPASRFVAPDTPPPRA